MIYVISDLHGYPFERFTALLKEVDFSENDFLYVLGDVVDRGRRALSLVAQSAEKRRVITRQPCQLLFR